MKKVFAALFLVFMLCACSAEAGEETLPPEYDADVLIRIDGAEYTAIYEKRIGTDKLTFLTPLNLQGLEFLKSDESVTATLGDLTLESAEFDLMFAFLPIEEFGEKKIDDREYTIRKREAQ